MSTSARNIGIIISSTRNPRVGPQIADLVYKTLTSLPSTSSTSSPSPADPKTKFTIIDVTQFNLPLFNEPGIPAKITSPSDYTHAHTRAWSREISSYSGFIFVTAQYNWGIPAALKNALDYLFNEWTGKPAFIVSYGGRGGGKAAEALRVVCQGLRMRVCEGHVELPFSRRQGMTEEAQRGILVQGAEEIWREELGRLRELWEEFEGGS